MDNSFRRVDTDRQINPKQPAPQRVDARPKSPNQHRSKWLKIAIIGLVVLAVLVAGWCVYQMKTSQFVRQDRYQAVFLANGQVYFGKLQEVGKYIRLSDIYYLQVQKPKSSEGTTNNADPTSQQNKKADNTQLIKLGEELHSPEDEMLINKDQLLFWENLKDGGKVVDAIKAYQKSKS